MNRTHLYISGGYLLPRPITMPIAAEATQGIINRSGGSAQEHRKALHREPIKKSETRMCINIRKENYYLLAFFGWQTLIFFTSL
jgi:hypothetical protein